MTILVNWYGPYDAIKIAQLKQRPLLVAISGKEPYKRKAKFYYLGLCENISTALRKVPIVTRERKYWVCEVAHAPVLLPKVMELMEHLFVNRWQPPFKEQRTSTPAIPSEPFTIIIKHFKADRSPRLVGGIQGVPRKNVFHWSGRNWWAGKLSL
jgi:hypothetical protein